MYLNLKSGFLIYFVYLFTFFSKLNANNSTTPLGSLVPPITEEGTPMAGKRVRIYLEHFPKAYYVLFLPYNFNTIGKWPVIVESPPNLWGSETGLPDDVFLGYGITQGMDYIWVCVPFINEEGEILKAYWGSNPLSTVNLWLEVLADLNKRFPVDNDKIILSGFSRGAVSTVYIGNYNDTIGSKWAAYFAHSHFDGCCQILLGNSKERLNRIGGRKILISAGEIDYAKNCSYNAYKKLVSIGSRATYIEIPNADHTPHWALEESESTEKAQHWLNTLFSE